MSSKSNRPSAIRKWLGAVWRVALGLDRYRVRRRGFWIDRTPFVVRRGSDVEAEACARQGVVALEMARIRLRGRARIVYVDIDKPIWPWAVLGWMPWCSLTVTIEESRNASRPPEAK